jgi:Tol biopolymer transport system component
MASGRWSILGASAFALLIALVVAHASPGAPEPQRSIVFSAHPDGSGPAQLFRVQTTGDGLAQITTGQRPATAPTFSPGGKQIAFVRLGSGIFRVNLDGTGLVRLTSGRRDSYPAWSADGRRIAFIRPYRGQWRVYAMSAFGRQERRLPQAPPAGRPSWTANGKSIFTPSAGDLVKIDSRSGRIQKFYGLTLDIVTGQTATVSRGARMIAYVGPRISTGPPDCGEGPCPQFGLYLARVTAPHRPRRIANDTGPAGWSPDGATLVFVSQGALELLAVGSGKRTSIASGPHIPTGDAPPTWQPR